MRPEEKQVRKFYEVIWNQHDKSAIPEILHESFVFRGSLGDEKHGYEGFAQYLDMIHGAFEDYNCIIKEIVSEQSKVFVKMQFGGVHKGTLMGCEPTGQLVTWDGAALFHFKDDKVSSIWVLGDVKSLETQLNE